MMSVKYFGLWEDGEQGSTPQTPDSRHGAPSKPSDITGIFHAGFVQAEVGDHSEEDTQGKEILIPIKKDVSNASTMVTLSDKVSDLTKSVVSFL